MKKFDDIQTDSQSSISIYTISSAGCKQQWS